MQPETDNMTADCLSHSSFPSQLDDDGKMVAEITSTVNTI